MMLKIARLYLVVLFCGSLAAAAAQETTGTILGTVTDSSGAVLPGVSISIRHVETSQTRTALTDEAGRYRVPALPVGSYEITVQLTGFQTVVRSGVVLNVAMEAVINVAMKVGEISQQVTVTEEAPLVNTTTATVSGVVDEHQMRSLPLNGRSFSQLALMQPNVMSMPFVSNSQLTNGTGGDLLVGGSRWRSTVFLLDGTETNDSAGRTASSASGNVLGVESVREFRVLTNNFAAEHGRASGGVVIAVTRSGTNILHGSAYEFFRSDRLDARNFFDVGKQPPPFTRNQFGVSLGGPIHRNRTFFFANYEGLRERLGLTNVALVPAAHIHQGLMRDPASPTGFTNVGVNAAVRPFLDTLFPLPNAGDIPGTDAGRLVTNPVKRTRENYITARVDQVLSPDHKVFGRYTIVDSSVIGHLPIPVSRLVGIIRNQYATIEHEWVASPRLVNTLRAGFNRSNADEHVEDTLQIPDSLRLVPGAHIGNLVVSGYTDVGEVGSLPRKVPLNLFEVSEDVAYGRSAHTVKFGFTFKHYANDTILSQRSNGRYDFASIRNFLTNVPRRFEAPPPGTDALRQWRQTLFAVYVQDDMKLTRRLTFNIGVRYEPFTRPDEKKGKLANLVNPLDAQTTVGEIFGNNPSLKNIQPRIGLAWDPRGDGKSSVRAAVGIFQDPLLPGFYRVSGTRNPPFFQSGRVNSPPFPGAYSLFQTPGAVPVLRTISTFENELSTPTYAKWHLTIERELFEGTRVSIQYAGNRGWHLDRQYEADAARPVKLADGTSFFPPNLPLRNPNWDGNLREATDVNSNYHGLTVGATRRLKSGAQFQVSYMWSKHIDEASGFGGQILLTGGAETGLVTLDPDNRRRDRGLSAWDRRHNFVASAYYELPFGQGRLAPLSGMANGILGGWTIDGIVNLLSGVPLNVINGAFDSTRNRDSRTPNRPDLRAGASKNPIVGDPNRWFDTSAFQPVQAGYFGSLGRNTLISPGTATVDLALIKRIPFGEAGSTRAAEIRVEMFNALNHANFGQPGRLLFAPDGSVLSSAGVITSTTTSAKQMQLGLRLTW